LTLDTDVIVVGAGLSGLVATGELVDRGRNVIVVDQEPEQSLGGQAWWSLGGLFMVDSPEQRHLGIHDSTELAWQDWQGSAGFDRPEDEWPRRWARAYVDFASGEKRAWLHAMGHRLFPIVGWAERGGYTARCHGNSVPRFHLTWGSGPAVVAPFESRVRDAAARGRLRFAFRHRVDELVRSAGAVTGVRGAILEPSTVTRGAPSSRTEVGDFELSAQAVVVTSGGIGGNQELVRKAWPARLGSPPNFMITGVPPHVDGRMLQIAANAGARLVNTDRMWHYTEGVRDWNPVWPRQGVRILPGPSSLWLDAYGKRLPSPLFPGFDTLGTLQHLRTTGQDYSWFVLTRQIIRREFALSGSDQNPDLTGKSVLGMISRALSRIPAPIQAFLDRGADFLTASTLRELVGKMNAITDEPLLDFDVVEAEVVARDREVVNGYTKDLQIAATRAARRYIGDRLIRIATPHRLLDPRAGPLIAVRLWVLTRKTLGGVLTDLDGRVLAEDGRPVPGLYAAGETAGFGGGGMHGYRALEGTFLGGCLFSGRQAGRGAARATA
jgi:predicted oxidoreductase